jgi:acetylornithine/succinyldiaminopimelate/putrescine aminotransferase
MRYTVFATGGGEAIDIAIKTARNLKRRRTIVCIHKAYHGHTGLAVAAGSDRYSTPFLADRPFEFRRVAFDDLDGMRAAPEPGDVAAVLLETVRVP